MSSGLFDRHTRNYRGRSLQLMLENSLASILDHVQSLIIPCQYQKLGFSATAANLHQLLPFFLYLDRHVKETIASIDSFPWLMPQNFIFLHLFQLSLVWDWTAEWPLWGICIDECGQVQCSQNSVFFFSRHTHWNEASGWENHFHGLPRFKPLSIQTLCYDRQGPCVVK